MNLYLSTFFAEAAAWIGITVLVGLLVYGCAHVCNRVHLRWLWREPRRPGYIEIGTLRERGSTEGGAALAQRRRGTGWRRMAESPEAETGSGLITGDRIVVGEPRSLSVSKLGAGEGSVAPRRECRTADGNTGTVYLREWATARSRPYDREVGGD